jgi:hypothetical protein
METTLKVEINSKIIKFMYLSIFRFNRNISVSPMLIETNYSNNNINFIINNNEKEGVNLFKDTVHTKFNNNFTYNNNYNNNKEIDVVPKRLSFKDEYVYNKT